MHRWDVVLVLSLPILKELVEVLRRPKFDLTEDQIHAALAVVLQIAEIVEIQTTRRFVEEDPDDDVVIQTALDGRVRCIVSGDRHLLRLGTVEGIPILEVRELLLSMLPQGSSLPPFERDRNDRY